MKHKVLKCYVVMVSRHFIQKHKRKGEETGFIEKIGSGEKIHTIRGNFDYWDKRIDKVQKGEAYISLRYWEGKPYNSDQIEFKRLYKEDGVGIEMIKFKNSEPYIFENLEGCDTVKFGVVASTKYLANKDGLSSDDFEEWFNDYDTSKPMAIIHFTPFRYLDMFK